MTASAVRSFACAVAFGALLLAAPAARAADDPFQTITPDELSSLLGAKDVRVYDANPREVYEKGRVPGAIFVKQPLAKLLPAEKDARLVFYCKNPK